MCFACLLTTTDGNCSTLTTDEFFFLEVGVVVASLVASFPTAIVRILAFKTLVIGESAHRKLLQIVVVRVTDFL